jgi:mRNA-degrading endonuclease RelE of RelBE toxin-antitoxin system
LTLALEPRPPGAQELAGGDLWRVRVGSLRVIYAIDMASRLVIVLRVARRAESTYRRVR